MASIGITCNALAQIGASFLAHNVVGLCFLPGLLLGIGMSASVMVYSVIPAHYFKRKRGWANSMVYAGGGLGGAVMSIAGKQYGRALRH
jgi:MFS family permease